MEVSGEVADLLVKEGLQVAEAAAKLAGKGAVNAAALLVALLKGNYKTVGKVGVERLNKENAEAVIVPIRAEDLSRFEKLAKQYGALYAAVQSKDGHSLKPLCTNCSQASQHSSEGGSIPLWTDIIITKSLREVK